MRWCLLLSPGFVFALTIILLTGAATPASAQSTALIEGLVVDRHGAVVPGVKITARNAAIGVERTTTSDTSASSVPMFDWRELKRWGISESTLPKDSVILFKEFTVWEQYKWRIVILGALLILETLIITALLLERRRRRRAKEALNAELETRIEARTNAHWFGKCAQSHGTHEWESVGRKRTRSWRNPLPGVSEMSQPMTTRAINTSARGSI